MADTILVTGGAGYVGSHVVVELARAGYAPVVLDNFANSTPAILPRLEALAGRPVACITADVRDVVGAARSVPRPPDRGGGALRRAQGRRRVGGAAARVLRRQRRRRARARGGDGRGRRGDARVQLLGDGVRPAGRAAGARRTRRCGRRTCTAAPSASSRISCATSRARTRTGASRCCATSTRPARTRRRCSARRRAAGRRTSCRCCAGSRPARTRELTVYGNDWPTPDGTGVRDYIHVQDLAEGHVAALRHLASARGRDDAQPRRGPRATRCSRSSRRSRRPAGAGIARSMGPRRPGDVAAYYADPARARDVLGWKPHARLDAICADAWRWHKNRVR